MTPFEVAMLAAVLCQNAQLQRSELPLRAKRLEPEDFLAEAEELLERAKEFLEEP